MSRGCVARLLALIVAVAGPPPAVRAQASAEALLETGIAQVRGGEFEAALFTLDTAIRRLAAQQGRRRELVRAHAYLGAAYVGLRHDGSAQARFREALRLDPGLRLSAEEFPPRAIQVFEGERLKAVATRSRKGRRVALIVGGAVAAGAVGIAAAKGSANRAPTASIGVSPVGAALPSVTNVTFTALASDPDGDALTFSWAFGDGATGSGATSSHVYASPGSYEIVLTVDDGGGTPVTARENVTVGTLAGPWVMTGFGSGGNQPGGPWRFQCIQSGAAVDCTGLSPAPAGSVFFVSRWHGTLSSPRQAQLQVVVSTPNTTSACTGEVTADLNTVRCTMQAGSSAGQILSFVRQP